MICPKCGKEVSDSIPFCELCGAKWPKPEEVELEEEKTVEDEEQEVVIDNEPKPLRGFVGALAGALAGCVVIVLLQEIGLIPSYGGIFLPFLIFIGYKLLNKNVTKTSLGVCIMFLLVTPYFADRATWAMWMIQNYKEFTFSEAFLGMTILVDQGTIDATVYYAGLLKIYIFTLAGTIAYFVGLRSIRKKMKKAV